jgi:hypothetical protein
MDGRKWLLPWIDGLKGYYHGSMDGRKWLLPWIDGLKGYYYGSMDGRKWNVMMDRYLWAEI